MGYMVRTEQHKYVEWRHYVEEQTGCTQPNWDGLLTKLRSKMKPVIQIVARTVSVFFAFWKAMDFWFLVCIMLFG
jgi:hypothetical protein